MIMNNIQKPNDIFIASVFNPESGLEDLVKSGITPDNTGFLSLDEYKKTKFAQDTFKDDKGNFNEDAFNKAYVVAANNFQELTDADFYKNLEKNIEYSPTSRARKLDSNVRDVSPTIVKMQNPFEAKRGISSMFGVNESSFSVRELAQKSNIWDTKNEKWLDKSPNDIGFLGTAFKEPLVYAQWDEDGMHFDEEMQREVFHQKGEYKLNEDNKFYMETLGDREMYGKQILSPLDVLSKDGSFLNKIDFFDSDGREKSITGTTFKTIAAIAPYLIPKFNRVWGGITAGIGLSASLPSLFKSLEGMLTGEDQFENQSSLWKTMNSVEGFMSKFTANTVSDKASESMLNYEQMASMVGDIFGQIYQQRAVASLSKLAGPKGGLKNITNTLDPSVKDIIEKQSQLAKSLSLGYMALTSAGGLYGEAIEAGFDRKTAGFGTLAALAGTYAVMNDTRMGTWFLDKTTGYSTEVNRGLLRKALKEPMGKFKEAFEKVSVNKVDGKNKLAAALRESKQSIRRVFHEAADQGEAYWKNSLVEGFEEVTEQVVMDAVKGGMDALNYLGVTRNKGDFGGFSNVFSKEGLTEYIMNFAGGLIGGAMFEFQNTKIEPFLNNGKIPKEVEYSLIRHIANGNKQDLIEEVQRQRKNIGNTKISPQTNTVDGQEVPVASNESLSEADLIADATIEYINTLDGILNQEMLNIHEDDIVKKALYSDFIATKFDEDNAGIGKLVLSDVNKIADSIVSLRAELDILTKEGAKEDKARLSVVKKELEEKRLKFRDIMDGKESENYVAKTLLYFKPEMHSALIALDKIQYAKSVYNVNYDELPEKGGDLSKEKLDEKFKEFQEQPELINKLDEVFEIYKHFQEVFSGTFKEYADSEYADIKNVTDKAIKKNQGISFVKNLFKQLDKEDGGNIIKNISAELSKSGLQNFTLNDIIDVDLFDYLVSNNAIAVGHLTEQEVEIVKEVLKTYDQLPISELNADMIAKIIDAVNKNPEILNKVIFDSTKIKPNLNLQLDAIFKFVEDQPKIDDELFNLIYNQIKYIYQNKTNLLRSNSSDLQAAYANIIEQLIMVEESILSDDSSPESLKFIEEVLATPGVKPEVITQYEQYKAEALEKLDTINQIKALDLNFSKLADNLNNAGFNYKEEFEKTVGVINDFLTLAYKIETDAILSISEIETFINDFSNQPEMMETFDKMVKNKQKVKNPIFDILRNMNLLVSGKTEKSIINLLEEESNLLSQSEIENYIKEGYTYEMIKQGVDVLKMAQSISIGMGAKQSEENPFGFNASIINYLKKNKEGEGAEKYNIISDTQTVQIYLELENLIDKLEFLLDISNSNVESKDKEHTLTRSNFNDLLLKHYEENNYSYDGKSLIPDKAEILNRTDITNEHKIVLMERSLYDSFQKLGIKTEEQRVAFVNDFFKNILNEGTAKEIVSLSEQGLSPNIKHISSKYLFNHLLSVLSTDSFDMSVRINKILQNEKFTFAPFFGQEYDARLAYSAHINRDLFKTAYEKAASLGGSSRKVAVNLVSSLGISGAGKTSVTGQYILKFLLQNDSKQPILISGPNQNRIDALNTALTSSLTEEELKNNINKIDKGDLFNKFLYFEEDGKKIGIYEKIEQLHKLLENLKTKPADSLAAIKKLGLIDLEIENNTVTKSQLKAIEEGVFKFLDKSEIGVLPTSIFIDEITHFSKFELELLHLIGEQYGITIFTFGDPSQKGFEFLSTKYSILELLTVNTPYLKSTVRSGNVHQKDNNLTLNVLSEGLEKLEYGKSGKELLDAQNKLLRESKRILKYYQNDNELHGSKLVNILTDSDAKYLFNMIQSKRAKTGSENLTLGIITIDGNPATQELETLKKAGFTDDMLREYSLNNEGKNPVQGQEGEYFLIKFPSKEHWKNDNTLTSYMSSLYTATSRALKGSILVEEDSAHQDFNIFNKEEQNTTERPFPIERINKVKDLRKKELDAIVGNSEIIKPSTVNTTPINTESTTDEEIVELDNLTPTIPAERIIEDLDNIEEETEPAQKLGHSIMFHTFYNRLGVNSKPGDRDVYVYSKKDPNKTDEDLQILNGTEGQDIEKKHIDSFIKLKNIVSLHYDNLKELESSILNNPALVSFLKDVVKIKPESFIASIKSKNFFIVGSVYEKSIDTAAFKFENDAKRELKNGDTFLRMVLKVKLDNQKDWDITIGVLPSTTTIQSAQVVELLGKDAVDNYVKFSDKIKENLGSSSKVEFKIDNLDRKFIGTSRTVKAIRDIDSSTAKSEIDLDKLEQEVPGVFINYNTLEGKETVGIFPKSKKGIQDEYNKGHKKPIKLKDDFLNKNAKGRPYVVLSFDNANQRGKDANQFRKVYPIVPKIRSAKKMFEEFVEYRDSAKKSNDQKTAKRNEKVFLSPWDGIRMFYMIKQSLSGIQPVIQSEGINSSWENYLYGTGLNTDKINATSFLGTTKYLTTYNDKSLESKIFEGRKALVEYLNSFATFDEFTKDRNDKIASGKTFNDPLASKGGFDIGNVILRNYEFNYTLDPEKTGDLNTLLKDIAVNIPNQLDGINFHYNAFVSKIETAQNVSEMDKEFLKYFTLNVVPEPPRFVMNLESIITGYLNDSLENITEQDVAVDVIEETVEVVDNNIETNEIDTLEILKNKVLNDLIEEKESQINSIDKLNPSKSTLRVVQNLEQLIEDIKTNISPVIDTLSPLIPFIDNARNQGFNVLDESLEQENGEIIDLQSILESIQEELELIIDPDTVIKITDNLKNC